ncbi:MAG: asparagine synthase (glutamine-hydrolyzing) [Nitrospinales bacterium]
MCGIVGIMSSGKEEAIKKMTDALFHRGPDDCGYYRDDFIALGQRRLSIIDLKTGRQPISNENDSINLICNGEIYNSPQLRMQLIQSGHRFKTSTDVEVILHLYEEHGKNCVKYLRGMFAFAIWDNSKQLLLLARDHLGQKAVFYCQKNGAFAFSSEVKGILSSGLIKPQIDLNGLWHYLSLRFMPDRYTLFKDIQKLPAASVLILENDSISIEKYWNLNFKNKLPAKEDEIIEGLDSLLLETVKIHLQSDVQVGAFLSGGLDSSTICAMMSTLTKQSFPTFSIGVKEHGFNELPYARMVVDQYRLEGHEKVVQADLIHLIPSIIYHMDEPSDPFAVGVYLVSKIASKIVKVVLTGDGGDENFAGYDRFAGNRLVDYYCLIPAWLRESIIKKIIDRIPESFAYKSLAQKAAWVHAMSEYTHGERYAQSLGFLRFPTEVKEQIFTADSKNQIKDYDSSAKILEHFDAENADDLIDRMLYTDLMTRMPGHLLSLVDRMTMAHSLESRAPLIDYKVVEFAASIPPELKLKGFCLKYTLRQLALRYLPAELINRKKVGFGFPLGIWMRTELKPFLLDLFKQSLFVELGIFERSSINKILTEHLSGKADHNYRLWILINLEIWYRLYFENQTVDNLYCFIDELSDPR